MKQITPSPEIQEIINHLPQLLKFIEARAEYDIQGDLQRLSDQITRKPYERELIIKKHIEIADNRYNELINSGLRITATDENHTLSLIGLWMVSCNTWKIPMPDKCSFSSLKPEPYNHIRAALYPVYYQYALIKACNGMLDDPGSTKTKGNGIQSIYTESQLKQFFKKLHEVKYLSGRQLDFVSGFQPSALPAGWQKIKWNLNNTELSVLVYLLTNHRPAPKQVNRIFITKTEFDSLAGGRCEGRGGVVHTLLKSLL